GRTAKTAPYDHPISIAEAVVTGTAVDVVALPAALQDLQVNGKWECLGGLSCNFALVQMWIFPELTSRNSSRNQRPRCPSVREKGTSFQRFVFRLVMHVLSAAGRYAQHPEN